MATWMDEYIKRGDVMKAYEEEQHRQGSYRFETLIKSVPSAEVAPVKHGQWIGSGDGYANGELVYDMWECSECGYDADGADEEPNWNYCPNCGARMDDV